MLTRYKQTQCICDLAAGLEPKLDVEELESPFDYIFLRLQYEIERGMDDPEKRRAVLTGMRLGTDEESEKQIIDDILEARPGSQPEFQNLHELGPSLPEVKWLWHGWIPRGYITVMAAYGGVGKTYLALHLAHCIIHDQPAPDGQDLRRYDRRNVIYVDAEGFINNIYRRTKTWGTNLDHFYTYTRPTRDMIDLADWRCQDQLIHMVDALQPELIVIDSLSTIHHRGERDKEHVNPILLYLHELANYADCGLILIHHPRKPLNGSLPLPLNMHDLSGTGQLTILPRSIIGIDYLTSTPNGPRAIRSMKNNITEPPQPIGMKFLPTDDPDVARMRFGTIAEIAPELISKQQQCIDWLLDVLGNDGPLSYQQLCDLGEELDFSQNTIQRTRKQLEEKIVDTVGAGKVGNCWVLAEMADQADNRTKLEACADWLLSVLADGPLPYRDLAKMAKKSGFSSFTLKQARKQLGEQVTDTVGTGQMANRWALAVEAGK